MLAFSIILINMMFYQIIIPLVKMIGFYRKTREEMHNCVLIVVCSLLDMTVLPIMIGSNLKEFHLSSFKGKHTDFDGSWYPQIGG